MTEKLAADNSGLRYDAGKAPMNLLPWDTLLELAHIYGRGAEKYAPHNWEKGMNYSKVFNSMIRHAAAFQSGEDFDSESEQMHMLHVAWNALALATYQLRKIGKDDRFVFAAIAKQNSAAMGAHMIEQEEEADAALKDIGLIVEDPINRDTALPKTRGENADLAAAESHGETRAPITPEVSATSPRDDFGWRGGVAKLGDWIVFTPQGARWKIVNISDDQFPTFTVQHESDGRKGGHIPAHIFAVVA